MAFSISPSTPLKLVSSSTTDVSSSPRFPQFRLKPGPSADWSSAPVLWPEWPEWPVPHPPVVTHHPGSQANWFHRSSKRNWDRHMPHYWGFSNVLWYVYHTSPDTEFKSLAGWLKAQLSQWSQFSCVDGDPLLLTHAGHSFYCSRTHTHARSLQTKHVTHSCTTMPLTPGSELKLWHGVGFVGEI